MNIFTYINTYTYRLAPYFASLFTAEDAKNGVPKRLLCAARKVISADLDFHWPVYEIGACALDMGNVEEGMNMFAQVCMHVCMYVNTVVFACV